MPCERSSSLPDLNQLPELFTLSLPTSNDILRSSCTLLFTSNLPARRLVSPAPGDKHVHTAVASTPSLNCRSGAPHPNQVKGLFALPSEKTREYQAISFVLRIWSYKVAGSLMAWNPHPVVPFPMLHYVECTQSFCSVSLRRTVSRCL